MNITGLDFGKDEREVIRVVANENGATVLPALPRDKTWMYLRSQIIDGKLISHFVKVDSGKPPPAVSLTISTSSPHGDHQS